MRRAFTLLEVVLAMSVAAVVMFGCAATLLNLANTAERVEGGWSLTKHADGAEKFLRAAFINSALLHASKIGNVSHQNASNTLAVAEIPESSETALAFEIDEQTPILLAAERFSPEKICYLSHDTDGLSLVWRHANAEKKNSGAVLYKTPLSPYVKKISYLLPDTNGWREEDDLSNIGDMPSYVKLLFERAGEKIERIIPLSGMLDPNLK